MIRGPKFWIPMAVVQVLFGLAVFAMTRQYYMPESGSVGSVPTALEQPSYIWPGSTAETSPVEAAPLPSAAATITDPVELSRQADEFFANKQFFRAAELYEQLLAFGPNNADTHNNLGITLHYLGRSAEALRWLNEGVALDPTHQRVWLTLGFVSSEVGNTEQARIALTNAVQMGPDNDVGQSAARMLENLP